SQQHFDKSQPD
ncbi:hypothetical protein D043_5281B, partial [Vibrio parahaemolyticus EKP-021]